MMKKLAKLFKAHPIIFVIVFLFTSYAVANLTLHTEALLDALLQVLDTDGDGAISDESWTITGLTTGAFTGTARSSAPGSPVAGTWYYADNEAAGWDPASIAGTVNYWVVYDGADYVAIIDEDGNLLIGGVRTKYIPIDSTDADDVYTTTAADCGSIITNEGDDDALLINLHDEAVSGGNTCCITIKDVEGLVITIDPNGTDRIATLTDTNGDSIDSDGEIETSITLCATSATEWREFGRRGLWVDGD